MPSKFKQVNLKISRPLQDCFNWSYAPAQSELIVFARVSDPAVDFETTPPDGPWLEATCAAVPWSLGVDIAIWNAVGWAGWGEWGACSRSCGGGLQLRRRYCSARACEGYEEQRRACNTFLCDDTSVAISLPKDTLEGCPPGWAGWGEWGACSRSCGGGLQLRRRYCSARACEGYEEQRRACNTFLCDGAINPLAPGARRNFHPAQARWGRVADRPHAFSLRPNSYIWIASSELFGADRAFPREFTLFVSLRLRPESGGYGQGTLFSLRSRRRTGAFLSLELTGRGAARLLHAGAGATSAIYLPVPLYDFRWHHIAISVHDDNTVRAYVDCRWLRTDVLAPGALDTPRDADLIIGYLFSGDLEQLVLVPKAGQAHKQCSSQIVGVSPSTDTNEV
ncbi:unnamed protein product [Plutella xylostella]|uniref:(diamondback moth) hypothetical protein n=1 Tax=Plutella xylostella TaxID=51655 RepID=A0A8S4FX03_PLUXY|nr:unnamed protein product [Plutella xylostella]